MTKRRIFTFLGMTLLLAACENDLQSEAEDVREARQEVRQTRAEGARDVREAQREATEDVAETHREAVRDVAQERRDLQEEMRELRERLAEVRADPDLSAAERVRLEEYERRYGQVNTRVETVGESPDDWGRVRAEVRDFGRELEDWAREATGG